MQKTVKDILPQLQTNYQGVSQGAMSLRSNLYADKDHMYPLQVQSVIEQLSVTYKRREQGMHGCLACIYPNFRLFSIHIHQNSKHSKKRTTSSYSERHEPVNVQTPSCNRFEQGKYRAADQQRSG